ncbi:AMP-binding protein [Streptomyces sp. NBC_01622]|uniref:AMP-binding protein n=1 Tax=Streptomyces sp. NBC_01622 TaxID=2975903 RepID=UPI003864C881|nr:AMP-binding protein [Streptomyces sp. NBC_01622]
MTSIKSTYPDVEIPSISVYDYIFGSLSETDLGRTAVVDGDRTLTYGEPRQAVDRFAGALAARGVAPGDVVGLHAPNGSGFAIAFHGILRAGATATALNAMYAPHEIANQLRDSGAST